TTGLIHPLEEVREAITRFTCQLPKKGLFEGGIKRGVTLAPVNTVADVLAIEQLAVRHYWDELRLPSGRTLRAAGPFVKASQTPIAWNGPAPEIGEHTAEVLDGLDRAASAPLPARPAGRRLPLEGVKVADFSWIGVGPITAKALADHGATVVHVETDNP